MSIQELKIKKKKVYFLFTYSVFCVEYLFFFPFLLCQIKCLALLFYGDQKGNKKKKTRKQVDKDINPLNIFSFSLGFLLFNGFNIVVWHVPVWNDENKMLTFCVICIYADGTWGELRRKTSFKFERMERRTVVLLWCCHGILEITELGVLS